MHHSNHRIGFKSKFGAIAALAGSAVGLGNIWKFPYVAGTNGGGAFLLVYIFFTIAIGLPVMLAEFSLGRRSQQNALGTFRVLAPGTKWFLFGLLSIIAATLILSFYGTVSGWTLEYVWLSISNSFHGFHFPSLQSTSLAYRFYVPYRSDYHGRGAKRDRKVFQTDDAPTVYHHYCVEY